MEKRLKKAPRKENVVNSSVDIVSIPLPNGSEFLPFLNGALLQTAVQVLFFLFSFVKLLSFFF
jgi:hypothetical protein